MPRSSRPERYPTVAFRLASILETHEDDFALSFDTQRNAIDTRQLCYSFSNACMKERAREIKMGHIQQSTRWHDIYKSFARWEMSVDPPYNKEILMLLDLPAHLVFTLKDKMPKYTQLEKQLSSLEAAPVDVPGPIAPGMDEVYRGLGLKVDKVAKIDLDSLIDPKEPSSTPKG